MNRDESIFSPVNHSVPNRPYSVVPDRPINDTMTENGFFDQTYVKEGFIIGGSVMFGSILIVIAIFLIRREKARRARIEMVRNRQSVLWRSSALISPTTSSDSVRSSFHSINMYGLEDDENVYEYLTPLNSMTVENPSHLNHYDPVSQSTFF